MPITYNKLVRDLIPVVIEDDGRRCRTSVIEGEALERAFIEKLKEELKEFEEKPCLEEMADLLEVLEGIRTFYGWSEEAVMAVKAEKRVKRGGFEKGIVLLEVE